MSAEWQPARFVRVHLGQDPYHERTIEFLNKTLIRVRPAVANDQTLADYRAHGCDLTAEDFVEMHPDDNKKLGLPRGQFIMCRHEILTD